MIGCFKENILHILWECHFTISRILCLSSCPPGKCWIHYLKTCHCFFSPHHSKFKLENHLTIPCSTSWRCIGATEVALHAIANLVLNADVLVAALLTN